MTRQVPSMNGYTEIWYNIGETENKGIELSLNGKIISRSDFNWFMTVNFSLNRDKITALRENAVDDIVNEWFIGEPLHVHYGYGYEGLWAADDAEKFAARYPLGDLDTWLGKPIAEDHDGDGDVDTDDAYILGSQLPSWTGGMYNEVNYKNWSLTMFINTVQGIKRSNGWYQPQSFLVEKNMNYLDVDYWRTDDPSDEFLSAGLSQGDPNGPNIWGNLLKDASFVRIQNVTLSYDLPRSAIKKVGISKLRIFVSAHNLLTFSSWLGWDPEANAWGSDPVRNPEDDGNYYGSIGQGVVPYPSARTFKIGVNLGL